MLGACGGKSSPTQGVELTNPPVLMTPTLTPSPKPPLVLNVCLAQAPGSLYRFEGRETLAKESVFAAIFDDSVLFEAYPTYDNALASGRAVDVKAGMSVLSSSGDVIVLKEGSQVLPALEGGLGEPAAWSSSAPLQMIQVSATYKIRPGLLWSDGSPITSADFLLAYQVARELRNARDLWLLDRTASLEGQDDGTLVWTGVPGFAPLDFSALVIQPLPAALFLGLSPEEIAADPAAASVPLGWGAYRIVSNEETIVLERNPYYVAQAAYDQVMLKVQPDLQQAIRGLTNGECDVLDPSYHLEAQSKEFLAELDAASLTAERFELTQQLIFGIKPAEYDSGYSEWITARQDFFGDARTRQAIATCLSAESIANEVLVARLPQGVSLPAFPTEGSTQAAQVLLEEVGWKTDEADPGLPRKASGVKGVLDGTVFSVRLLSGTSAMDMEVSQAVIRRLGMCGIEVNHTALQVAELYAPGPGGVLFGRQFDLALAAWQGGSGRICELYLADAIPDGTNYWIGTNLAGLAEAGFDTACTAAGNAFLAENAGDVMTDYWPAVPLMPQIRLWAVSDRVDLAGSSRFEGIGLWRPAARQ